MKTAVCPQCGAGLVGDLSRCYVCGWGFEELLAPAPAAKPAQLKAAPAPPVQASPPLLPPPPRPAPVPTAPLPLPKQILPPKPPETPKPKPFVPQTAQPPIKPRPIELPDIPVPDSRGNLLNRLGRFKPIAIAGGAVLVVLIGLFGHFQMVAGQDLRKGSLQLQQQHYAEAAKTLAHTPGFIYPPTAHRIHVQLDKAKRWTADSTAVAEAKKALEAKRPEDALSLLSNISSDYPDQQAVQKLIGLADQAISNPSANISQEVADVSTPDSTDNSDSSFLATDSGSGDGSDTVDTGPADTTPTPTPTPTPQPKPAPTCAGGTFGLYPTCAHLVKLYASWNSNLKDHHFGTSSTPPAGYTSPTCSAQVFDKQLAGTVPLAYYYSSANTDHYYRAGGPASNITVHNATYTYQGLVGGGTAYVYPANYTGNNAATGKPFAASPAFRWMRYWSPAATDSYWIFQGPTSAYTFGYTWNYEGIEAIMPAGC